MAPRKPPVPSVGIDEQRAQVILEVRGISVSFEGFYALSDINMDIRRNTIHFFIGPNGAGKTTLLDIICGKIKPSAGNVLYHPQPNEALRLTRIKEYQIANAGVARKFQVPSVFVNLTVWDNMVLSLAGSKGLMPSLFGRPSVREEREIESMLARFGLLGDKDMIASSLAHGKKQHLEIAMQLLGRPGLLMLDEPAAGMGRAETEQLGRILQECRQDCSIIVVEHDMDFVKQIADVVTVLHEGKILLEGSVQEVLADATVQAVYLGRGAEA
jgi:urea transport system ATP-binding protein